MGVRLPRPTGRDWFNTILSSGLLIAGVVAALEVGSLRAQIEDNREAVKKTLPEVVKEQAVIKQQLKATDAKIDRLEAKQEKTSEEQRKNFERIIRMQQQLLMTGQRR